MAPNGTEKARIRKRDQKYIPLSGICERCGKQDVQTSRHHLWYPERFDPASIIEVCDECDDKIHDREDAESAGRTINAINNLVIEDGDVWLAGTRIGIANFNEDGKISIDMVKR